MDSKMTIWLAAALFSVAALLGAAVAAADEEERECVEMCKVETGAGDCRFDAREERKLCVEQADCEALREAYTEACLGDDPDEAECNAARTSLRECVSPCHEAFHSKMETCDELMATCLEDICGLEPGEGCKGRRGRGTGRR